MASVNSVVAGITHEMKTKPATYQPISCDIFDYVEIACLYRYKVILRLLNGDQLDGIAVDTKIDGDRQEWIILQSPDSQTRLDKIIEIEVTTPGAKFDKVKIQSDLQ